VALNSRYSISFKLFSYDSSTFQHVTKRQLLTHFTYTYITTYAQKYEDNTD